MSHILLEHAVHRGRSKEHHIRAQVVFPLPAIPAMAAGLPRLQGHPVANLQVGHLAAHLHHCAAGLMAQDEGRLHHKIADGPGLVIMHIGTADAYIFQLNQNLILLGGGDGTLGEAHLADSFHNCHTHTAVHK